ncbi:MAG: adenylyl-sulfate kinase [Alphaproteobacteria bacterium]|nr:adenylyl-sulfate kinase [Alphaproteobacteria bacterium]HCP00633.1 adenylyl-sulfate kinase [Rhodospirillaceae bacterium]
MANTPNVQPITETASPAQLVPGPQMRVVIVGHVDHGKSTLVGRLFHDTGQLPDGKLEAIEEMCRQRGMPFEWAFLMDSLKAERDQGITIDTSQIWFRHGQREYVLIDAPGHREFIRNMVTGASNADAALLMIDADQGIRRQSRHHMYLLQLLGVREVAVAVNKMDLVKYDEGRFRAIEAEYRLYLEGIGITPRQVIPISAREGDNVATPSERMCWFNGPSFLETLPQFAPPESTAERPLRLPLQDVYKFDERRILAGRIESGTLRVGDDLVFSPSNRTARIETIETWNTDGPVSTASAGMSVGITLNEQIFVERGEIVSHEIDAPIESDVFHARLFWLADKPLEIGAACELKIGPNKVKAVVEHIERIINIDSLSDHKATCVSRDEIADVIVRTSQLVAFDAHETLSRTGRVVFVDQHLTLGGGVLSLGDYPDQRQLITVRGTNLTEVDHRVDPVRRIARNRHKPGVLWFTGLSGAGKSTLAMGLEQRLFDKGYQVYVLDGDNVRTGLNANLGFSPEDRAENIRRVGEVAALLADAGLIVITAFISPYRADRERAREAAGEAFHEVFIDADVATCESRDPKGLYKRARSGEIKEFTGVSAPYEEPSTPDFSVDTSGRPVDECLDDLVTYVTDNFITARERQ